jgi:hypothetical protein
MKMSRRKGTVSRVGKSKYSYYIQLDGDGFYFNTKYEPKCGIGDVVGIEFEKKADNRGNIQKVKLLEDNGAPKGVQESQGGGGKGGGSYQADPDRQASIVFQSSRKDALVFTGLLLSNEAVKLPKDTAKRATIIEALVEETTASFFKDASNPKAAVAAEDEVLVWRATDGPLTFTGETVTLTWK